MQTEESLWSPVERGCLSLLHRSNNTRISLLQIHSFMLRRALETNVNLFTKFLVVCASVVGTCHARRVFDYRLHRDDSFLCNSMIKAHLGMHQFGECFALYRDLRRDSGFVPDNFTFTSLAKCCGLNSAVCEGLEIHSHAIKNGLCLYLYVSTALVDMYAKFGKMNWARKLFDEMTDKSQVSWTALIGGYVKAGDINSGRKLFDQMPEKDSVAYNAMIDGYVKVRDMLSAQGLFDEMPERNVISFTSMIYGYCSDNDVISARSLFDAMPEKNLISWNTMIGGYCQNKQPREALNLFHELQSSTSLEPDKVTIVSILPAIADLGALTLGGWVHHYVQNRWGAVEEIKGLMRRNGAKKEAGCSVVEVDNRILEFVSGQREFPEWEATHSVLGQLGIHMRGQGSSYIELAAP
ncbi:hypothetical protein HS088_TW17G00410 [Tripterygium wilfordii]|uniref:Pentatricopeptide repeat-containing protein n=1 Tax=Tripterygium wilfordii TaxID=458696 RepID=A0A7J7CG03_TRIWF|nr:hypothetical protein HS088_TW17G00410 [Tripterygium wilfordii]